MYKVTSKHQRIPGSINGMDPTWKTKCFSIDFNEDLHSIPEYTTQEYILIVRIMMKACRNFHCDQKKSLNLMDLNPC